jgi:dihydropteroate synthase
VVEVREFLEQRILVAMEQGIARDRLVVDPGIGFGKRLQDNLALLKHVNRWCPEGIPALIGASRKSFIGLIDPQAGPDDRLPGTLAAHLYAALVGSAQLLRVHDVAAMARVAKMTDAIVRRNA